MTAPITTELVRGMLGPGNQDVNVLVYGAGPQHPVWKQMCASHLCPRLTRHRAVMSTTAIAVVDVSPTRWAADLVREFLASVTDDEIGDPLNRADPLLGTATYHCPDALLAEIYRARQKRGVQLVVVEVPTRSDA
jgi:hypothetical protein